ncbi:MAG: glycerate kinase [Pseudomonadota bacterium]|nr:glycerate kinase [Pseudomonadota bacterium]
MITLVIAPDSFKGSIPADAAATAIATGMRRVWPDADLRLRPMADGGEGTLDIVLSRGGMRRTARVAGAAGAPLDAGFGLIDNGATAVIEIAQVVGLTDAAAAAVPVERRSTRGLGELVRLLLDAGVRNYLIGLGGSSTNDGGAGLLAALGLKLADGNGRDVDPTPAGLAALAEVDASVLDSRLAHAHITIMSDVDNPLCGERGATAIFGAQKGVRAESVAELDARLARFAALTERAVDRSAKDRAGAGAAGGLGFALQLLGGQLRSGAQVIADLLGLDAALEGADWLITGEGRSDRQTLLGKAPFVAAKRAAAKGVPATLISGAVDRDALPELDRVFSGCHSLAFGPATLEDCLANAAQLLADRAQQLGLLFAAARARR